MVNRTRYKKTNRCCLICGVILILTCNIYAEPLIISYKEDTIIINNPIVDRICNDNKFRNLAKDAYDAVNQKDYKRLILIGTKALKICVSKLGAK
ncbi:hypothetical protein LCGC14_2161200 [marine sediment metagenome]|uniref:Uncharacterized protein n=1 Tax=marine sediment metagenome TaxID=412755 RepID=A0A0F9EF18_9ZZZZ